MKSLNFFILLVLSASCREDKARDLKVYCSVSSKAISVQQDVVYYNGVLFTGFLYDTNVVTGDTVFCAGYSKGLLHGVLKKWYPNGLLMEERFYSNGQKNGKQKAYWDNRQPKFEFVAKADAYEGELKEWTINGKLIHLANFKEGQEEGVQKLWYDNGKIRANYVIINGRRYGLLGTKNCKNVSDSIFIVQ